ncbi:MAG: CAAD domain-containing protein [Microcoleaceae cyanobacterium]
MSEKLPPTTPSVSAAVEVKTSVPSAPKKTETAPSTTVSTTNPEVTTPAETAAAVVTQEKLAAAARIETQALDKQNVETITKSTTNPEVTTPAETAATVVTQEKLAAAAKTETQTLDEQNVETITHTGQLQKIKQQLLNILSNFPDYISQFYQQYKSQLTVVGLIIVTILTLRLIIGLLEVLEEMPILSFTFELVGIGYTVWFVYRYLLGKSKRKELLEKIQEIKAEILGRGVE